MNIPIFSVGRLGVCAHQLTHTYKTTVQWIISLSAHGPLAEDVFSAMFTIHELHEYSDRVRTNFANKLAELSWSEVEKNREASFYSMKNILLHMIDNEEWMVNWVIRNKSKDYVRKKSEEYTSMKMMLDHLEEVEEKSRQYFTKLNDSELSRRVKFTTSAGQTFDLPVEECLLQSFTEQLYHIGELIALLWQDNVEPPKMQWFWNNPRVQTQIEQSKSSQSKSGA